MIKKYLRYASIAGLVITSGAFSLRAEEPDNTSAEVTAESEMVEAEENQVLIPPLFEYVVAPDDLPDLTSRTDYLMQHFWDPFDFKKTEVVDQNALNHAFSVYVQAMAYASQDKIDESIKNLIGKIKNKPGLSYQFAKAAEENLYGPRAELWGDAVYMEFLQNLLNNKKVSEQKKRHFEEQYSLLKNSSVGAPLPHINVKNMEGTPTTINPNKEFTLIEFTFGYSLSVPCIQLAVKVVIPT